MFRMTVSEPFRMKLHTQQKRQPTLGVWFQLHGLNDSVPAPARYDERISRALHSLMVRAVHAQRASARYLGEERVLCQMHIVNDLALLVLPLVIHRAGHLAAN